MQVVTWHGGTDFTFDEVASQTPGPDEVVVRVEAVGVCGTDVHITQGLFPAEAPQVLGHEGAGVVVDVGAGVSTERIGQRVVMDTTSHCGECENCRTWSLSRCERSRKASGFYAEAALVPVQCAHPIPETMSFEIAALTEPAACCIAGVESLAHVQGASAVIIGGGIMGQLCLALLRRANVGHVIVSEPIAERRQCAAALGADVVHDPGTSALADVVRDLTRGHGVDIAIEAVGKPELVAQSVQLTRPRGQVLMIGVCPPGSHIPIDAFDFHYREIRLFGAFGRGNVFARTPSVLAELSLAPVLSKAYPLSELPLALHDASKGKGVKLFIKPNG
ncbi:MAG: alcohol dehydrogenase catalytic domain-containing protein [Pseudomonadota bacterium]